MNAYGVLTTPWYAMRRSSRWIILALALLIALGATWMGVGTSHRNPAAWAIGTAMMVGIGLGMLCLFGLAPTLLLAVDARLLRLPRIERQSAASVVLYVLLMVVVPGLLISAFGGQMPGVFSTLAVGVTAGLAIALLPRVLSFFIWLMPAMFNIVQPILHLPGALDPRFPWMCGGLAAIFTVLSVVCWVRAVHNTNPYGGALGAPLVMQFRSALRTGWTGMGGTGVDTSTLIRRNPAWLQPRVDVRGSGPGHPVTSLRVGLGGLFAPLTTGGRVMQLGMLAAVSAIFILQMAVQAAQRVHGAQFSGAFVHRGLEGMLMWGAAFGGSMLAIMPVAQLTQRWLKQNAELPLLALLPGLGDAMHAKRRLLCASLLPPVAGLAALMALTTSVALVLHASAVGVAVLMLSMTGAMAFLSAFIISVIGGRPLGRWSSVGLCIFGYVLFSVSTLVPMLGSTDTFLAYAGWFIAAWTLLLCILGWLALRGWRGLMRRPHAFLANAR